jgi:hypothetical protein
MSRRIRTTTTIDDEPPRRHRRRKNNIFIVPFSRGCRTISIFCAVIRRQAQTQRWCNLRPESPAWMDTRWMGGGDGVGCHEGIAARSGDRESTSASGNPLFFVWQIFTSGFKVLRELWNCPLRCHAASQRPTGRLWASRSSH